MLRIDMQSSHNGSVHFFMCTCRIVIPPKQNNWSWGIWARMSMLSVVWGASINSVECFLNCTLVMQNHIIYGNSVNNSITTLSSVQADVLSYQTGVRTGFWVYAPLTWLPHYCSVRWSWYAGFPTLSHMWWYDKWHKDRFTNDVVDCNRFFMQDTTCQMNNNCKGHAPHNTVALQYWQVADCVCKGCAPCC